MRSLRIGLKYSFLSLLVIGFVWWVVKLDLNAWKNNIMKILPYQEGAMLKAMVMGDKGDMSKNMYAILKDLGVVHMMVVSGTNVMFMGRFIIDSLSYIVGRKMAILMGLLMIWKYGAFVGWEAPVLRALLIISIYYGARLIGRKINVFRVMLIVAGLMILMDIQMLISWSFWLSFVAYTAMLLSNDWLWWRQTIWISVCVTPLISLMSGKISLVAPLANVLLFGLIPWITGLGLISMMVPFVKLVWIVYPFVRLMADGVLMIYRWMPWVIEIRFNIAMMLGYYLVLFALWKKNIFS